MKKEKSGIAKQIAALMNAKSLVQAGLAHEIGVSPSRISEYLAGNRSPSSNVLWKLGKLAPFPQNLWFWEQAGLSKEEISAAARRIGESHLVRPEEGHMVEVGALEGDGVEEESKKTILLPPNLVNDPASTRYFVIDGEVQMGAGVQKGDIVILDTSGDIATSLEALWANPVLSKWSRPAGITAEDWGLLDQQDEGFLLGTLRCKADAEFRDGRAGLKDWVVVVEPFHQHTAIYKPDAGDWCIGEMKVTQKDWKVIGAPRSLEELPAKEPEVRRMRFKLFDSAVILGRVIGWFRPPRDSTK